MKNIIITLILAVPLISGCSSSKDKLRLGGSDTMDDVIKRWASGYAAIHPGEKSTVHTKDAAFDSLVDIFEGRADISFYSRRIREKESAAIVKKVGYAPLEIAVGTGAPFIKDFRSTLGVLVHPDNPLRNLTFAQADAIFSKTRLRGGKEAISKWGQLGLGGKWADQLIHTYVIKTSAGPCQFFCERVLNKGTIRPEAKELSADDDAVRHAVAADPLAIGVTTLNFGVKGVRPLALSEESTTVFFEPTNETVATMDYPLARHVYAYLNRPPGSKLDERIASFIEFVLSPEGQKITVETGFLALQPAVIPSERAKLD